MQSARAGKTSAFQVRIRGRYVSRPSGKCRHTSQSQIPSPSSRGSKTGLMMRRPFAFCCVVGCAGLCCLFICCRCAFWKFDILLTVHATEDKRTEYAVTFAVTFHRMPAIHCLTLRSIPVPAPLASYIFPSGYLPLIYRRDGPVRWRGKLENNQHQ